MQFLVWKRKHYKLHDNLIEYVYIYIYIYIFENNKIFGEVFDLI
jgi:hypothetical protein